MNRYFVFTTLFIIMLSGCAPKHFVEKNTSTLTFYLRIPEANRVQFAASFDHYILHDVQQNNRGSWQIKIPMTSELKYFYIVDGLIFIPECRFKEKDDFGAETCLYLL